MVPIRGNSARVSTSDQNLDLQRDALRRAGCRRIHEDRASGGDSDRPQLRACLESVPSGDCLVAWRLDRIGRSLTDLIRGVANQQTKWFDYPGPVNLVFVNVVSWSENRLAGHPAEGGPPVYQERNRTVLERAVPGVIERVKAKWSRKLLRERRF